MTFNRRATTANYSLRKSLERLQLFHFSLKLDKQNHWKQT